MPPSGWIFSNHDKKYPKNIDMVAMPHPRAFARLVLSAIVLTNRVRNKFFPFLSHSFGIDFFISYVLFRAIVKALWKADSREAEATVLMTLWVRRVRAEAKNFVLYGLYISFPDGAANYGIDSVLNVSKPMPKT